MGFLDMTPEQADSMLNFGIGLLAASGPSSRPVGFGQVLASGLQNMQQGSELARKNKMEQEQFDLMKSYRTLQEQQMQADMQQKAQQLAMQKRLMESLPGLISGQPQQTGYGLNPNPDSNNVRLDPNAESDIFQAAGKLEQKAKMGGKLTPDEQMLLDQVKSRIQPRYAQSQPNHMNTAQLGVTAGVLGLKGGEQLMQLAKMQQPDMVQVNDGRSVRFVNRNDPNVGAIPMQDSSELAFQKEKWAQEKASQAQDKSQNFTVDLRKEFSGLQPVKDWWSVQPVLLSARDAAKIDNKAADLNLIYAAAKIYDPGSVVRESETAMHMATGSPAEQFQGLWSSVVGGGRLTPALRAKIMQQLETRAAGYESSFNATANQYRTLAEKRGVSPDDVITAPPTTAKAKTAIKQVVATGNYQGRKVVKYSDGSLDYAD